MDQPMSNCQKCGSVLKPEDKFCSKCGAGVPAAEIIPGLQPVKRQRWDWLPWVVGLITASTVLIFLMPMAVYTYRDKTGYFDRKNDLPQKVTVTDAVNETFSSKLFGENTKFAYPEVSIKGKNTNTANRKIAKDLEEYHTDREGDFAADYSYYVNKDVVSIVVEICYAQSGKKKSPQYFVYNISVSNGRLLDNERLIREYGISERAFIKKVEETYNRYFETADLNESEKEELKKDASLVTPYIGRNGHLCFATVIQKEDGYNEEALFDTKTKKVLKGPIG